MIRIAEFNSQIPNEIEISSQTTLDTGEASSKRIERWWKKSHHQQPKVTPRLTESSKTSHYNPKVFEESRDEFIPVFFFLIQIYESFNCLFL